MSLDTYQIAGMRAAHLADELCLHLTGIGLIDALEDPGNAARAGRVFWAVADSGGWPGVMCEHLALRGHVSSLGLRRKLNRLRRYYPACSAGLRDRLVDGDYPGPVRDLAPLFSEGYPLGQERLAAF